MELLLRVKVCYVVQREVKGRRPLTAAVETFFDAVGWCMVFTGCLVRGHEYKFIDDGLEPKWYVCQRCGCELEVD